MDDCGFVERRDDGLLCSTINADDGDVNEDTEWDVVTVADAVIGGT